MNNVHTDYSFTAPADSGIIPALCWKLRSMKMRQIEVGHFSGMRDDDGYVIGYDYQRQVWVDERPQTQRDPAMPLGSACNPLQTMRGVQVNYGTI